MRKSYTLTVDQFPDRLVWQFAEVERWSDYGSTYERRSAGGDVWRQASNKPGTASLRKLPLSEKTTTTTRIPPPPLGAQTSQRALSSPSPTAASSTAASTPDFPSSAATRRCISAGIYDDVSTQLDKINLRCTGPARHANV